MPIITKYTRRREASVRVDSADTYATVHEDCYRCGGAGKSVAWAATGFTCYLCCGERKLARSRRIYTAEQLDRMDAAEARLAEKRRLEAEAARAERLAAEEARIPELLKNPVYGYLHDARDTLDFASSLWNRLIEGRPLTEAQEAAAQKLYQKSLPKPPPQLVGTIGEKLDVYGTVVFVKTLSIPTAYHSGKELILIKTEAGDLAWYRSTTPYSFSYEAGQKVVGTCKVKDHKRTERYTSTIITNFRARKEAAK